MDYESFNTYIEEAIKNNWERIALSDFDGVSYHYKDIARKIAKIHLLLESAEISMAKHTTYKARMDSRTSSGSFVYTERMA